MSKDEMIRKIKLAIGRTAAEWAARQAMSIPQRTLVECQFAAIDEACKEWKEATP